MYATIRSYSGQALADALATRESDIRQVIATIAGFHAYYLVRTTDGNAVTITSSTIRPAPRSPRAPRQPGSARTWPTWPRARRR